MNTTKNIQKKNTKKKYTKKIFHIQQKNTKKIYKKIYKKKYFKKYFIVRKSYCPKIFIYLNKGSEGISRINGALCIENNPARTSSSVISSPMQMRMCRSSAAPAQKKIHNILNKVSQDIHTKNAELFIEKQGNNFINNFIIS